MTLFCLITVYYGIKHCKQSLILEYAFNELKLDKVFLRVYKDNPGAIRSYEKAGFKKTDGIEKINDNGAIREVIFMELEKKDFEKR